MSIIVCKMPKAGLGNQLFPLMKAIIQQQTSGLPLIVTHYRRFSIGPYLRKEKSKRNYQQYFIFQKSFVGAWIGACKLLIYPHYKLVQEYPLNNVPIPAVGKFIYLYKDIPHWSNYFDGLKDRRDDVKAAFFKLLSPEILQNLKDQQTPCIGVHIRMGDFRKLQYGENFAKVGAVRTPEEYFIETIKIIRSIAGKILPVTIFTDGQKNEFNNLFNLSAVILAPKNKDIVDLILLSKSKLIITSAGSTFSYWAGFLADAPMIMHPDHIHKPIRPDEHNKKYFEGAVLTCKVPQLLQQNIKQMFCQSETRYTD